ncbi:unnamed protein product [Rotaria socialis]|uniref:Uncharacterized protein n=1 Tax=Rotaria socialis TaxID=392032 RepID=A0A821HF16_9BILA|nr:unnamed protein product [Rotaria socialis]CAF4683110.1 unnamed protein product [Rotaria socialis]
MMNSHCSIATLYVRDNNHEPNSSVGQVAAARTRISDTAKQSSLTTHTIVADAVSKLSDNAISSLPNLQNLKSNVRKIRERSQNPLSLPTTRDSIVIDPQYTITARNRTFLHFDSGSIDQRVLIFLTKKQLKIWENALYSENDDFAKQIRSLPTLALLPVPDVIPTFDEIKAQFPTEDEPC